MFSQQWFNFAWIALTAHPSHPLHSFRSESDGCNSCCHGEVWRHTAEAKTTVLGLLPLLLHRKATTLNGLGTCMTSGKLKIPMDIRLQES